MSYCLVWGGAACFRAALLAGTLACLLGACETTFEPFVEKGYYFSIFGYLDATADTQFVRVTNLRDSIVAAVRPLDAVVTSDHVASGEQVVWRDSLFFFNGRPVHNFWTTATIEAGETYHFSVRRADGATSEATVTVPDPYPDPVFFAIPFTTKLQVEVTGIDRLADIQLIYWMEDPATGRTRRFAISHLAQASHFSGGFVLTVDPVDDLASMQ